ncbi:MAG: metal ABC transporter permease [Verrucomicrobiota bacterium]|jgi:manganese/zinc/iron transport system permease protein|nr:metal ABC transporter permease [Verrucomicrobiota bacterium]MDG1890048.1 metal ABC transporter permease [Verrucomicrobiota bacterium]
MRALIPTWDWHTIFVAPWTTDFAIYGWIFLMGFLVCAACGLAGNYLILRRMALVGDAISHSVLPGLAIAFLAANAWRTGMAAEVNGMVDTGGQEPGMIHGFAMFTGAMVAGVVTTLMIEIIHKHTRIKQDAAIGITFSTLFALGVVLISVYADKVDLDADCVLHGEIAFVSIQPFFSLSGVEIAPASVVLMGLVAILTLGLIVVFYKELLVSSFDPGLASSMGIHAGFVHYALMCWLSVIVVSAFEAVGAILVIAMLILPGATASMLSTRFPVVLSLSLLHAAVSSILGLHLAIWLNSSTAGSMVVAGAGLFGLVWLFSPSQGLLRRWVWLRKNKRSALQAESLHPPYGC